MESENSINITNNIEIAENPIIWADVPDPDVIRVNNEYFMVSTTMHMMPGSPIMKSTDLVNWEIISYPYDILEDNDTYKLCNGMNAYGKGSWAASLRYHKGTFYLLFGALDTGKTYLFFTQELTEKWERIEFNTYLHDPSLLFDDDKAYIIYGGTNIRIAELTLDYKSINHNGLNKVIIASGRELLEGSHAYKINGKYYITAIEWIKGDIRKQYIYRADKIDGPYEERLVLRDTMGYKNNGIAQGGLVDTPDGKWFAILHQDHDAVGRVPVLVPVRWEDGWPVLGNDDGKVPIKFIKPGHSLFMTEIVKSDDFNEDKLGLNWQWNHNPDNTKWTLSERKGYLRLSTCSVVKNILQARNTLTQRTQGPYCSGWILMDTSHMIDGDYAGLAAFQQEYGFIGITKDKCESYILMFEKGIEISRTKLIKKEIYLKIDFDFTIDEAAFFYSYNSVDWIEFGSKLKMRYTIPQFMGYRFAIFNYATKSIGGYVDIDYFRFANRLTGNKT